MFMSVSLVSFYLGVLQGHQEYSPLQIATVYSHTAIVGQLLAAGADVQYAHPESRDTAVLYASRDRNAEVCCLSLVLGHMPQHFVAQSCVGVQVWELGKVFRKLIIIRLMGGLKWPASKFWKN